MVQTPHESTVFLLTLAFVRQSWMIRKSKNYNKMENIYWRFRECNFYIPAKIKVISTDLQLDATCSKPNWEFQCCLISNLHHLNSQSDCAINPVLSV